MNEIVNKVSIILFFMSTLMLRAGFTMISHFKCRGGVYPRSNVERFPVPDDKVNWTVEYIQYEPPSHTSSSLRGKPWADPEIGNVDFKPKWNTLDNNINRESYMGTYNIVNNYPLNPIGRTGIAGRGVLGRWGPNHAADPVVTRWKKLENGEIKLDLNNRPILQFIAIKRSDSGEWAIPGGMVDPGEKVSAAAVREFQEEATNGLTMSADEKESWQRQFQNFFAEGDEIYRGYVDDIRNTDNAWMETIAYNFHDEEGAIVGALSLNAGDDAVGVRWVDITPDLKLYANHAFIVKEVINRRLQLSNN